MRTLPVLNDHGNIPSGQPCPFHTTCTLCAPTCPTPGNLHDAEFSCALARGFAATDSPAGA